METEESVKQEVKAEEDVTSISAKRRRKRKGLAEVDLGVNARFSAKLRELRLTARMTQVETAAKLGFSMVKYSRLECGRSGPTWASAVKAAQLFNVTLDTFLQEANPTPLPGRSNNASPESMGIGHRIRFYREMLGLTQLELAMAVDLRASDLSRIEFGLRSLHVSKLVPIANALGISVNKLVVGEE
jgi:transcriptional regulator with XRE-family HTH domain